MMDELLKELTKISPEDIANFPKEIAGLNLPPMIKELAIDNWAISMRMMKRAYDNQLEKQRKK